METFADIVKKSKVAGRPFVDHATPAGHFGVTNLMLGITSVYLLEGELGAPDAIIKGRVELPAVDSGSMNTTYVGNYLKGGTFSGFGDAFEASFAKMV